MDLGLQHAITDICLIVPDVDRSIDFYEKIGFQLRRRNEGFADFDAAGTTLALWEGKHLSEHVGFAEADFSRPSHRVMTAMRVASDDVVNAVYDDLLGKGIAGLTKPQVYEWNAYAVYFTDPDGNVWEVYAWRPAGPYDAGVPPENKPAAELL